MLVARWDEVHHWPDGLSEEFRDLIAEVFGVYTNLVSLSPDSIAYCNMHVHELTLH